MGKLLTTGDYILFTTADYMLPGLGGHLRRVGESSGQIAEKLSLPEAGRVKQAGFYHDIGKLTWPEHLRFGEPEGDKDHWAISNHPSVGADIVTSSLCLSDLAPFIRHHHERFDGKGRPGGLVGADIPLGARIIAVCDVADAITMERSYDPAQSHEEMIEIIKSAAGSHLDPEIVSLYTELFPA